MVSQVELLNKQFALQRRELARDLKRANKNLPKRVRESGVTFDLDPRRDVLTISLGSRPHDVYTQGTDDLYIDIELSTDRIIGFTILDFEREFLVSPFLAKDPEMQAFFTELQPLLVEYGTLSFPPERTGTSKVGVKLGTLLPLFSALKPHTVAH